MALQQKIHQTARPSNLQALKAEIVSAGWNSSTENPEFWMFFNHLGREFNKKCVMFNMKSLLFTTSDAGFRPFPEATPPISSNLLTINAEPMKVISGDNLVTI